MTRVNVGIPAVLLSRAHLLSEHREMIRIPNAVRRLGKRVRPDRCPDTFRLNKGHVLFFYPRLGYLRRRYRQVHQECLARGYAVQDYSAAWDGIPAGLMGDYASTPADVRLLMQRIDERGGLELPYSTADESPRN